MGEEQEIEARIDERADLLDRLDRGDTLALAELLDHAIGTEASSVKVTVPRPGAPAAGG